MELQRKDLWEVIGDHDEKPPRSQSAKYKTWMRKEGQALGEIVSYVEDSQLNHTRLSADPKVVWDRLAEVHEVKGWAAKIRLRKQLLGIRKRDEQSMQEHINAVNEIVQRLAAINHRPTEDDIIATLFVSVSDEYDAVIVSLESLDEDKLTVKWVQQRLLAHEAHLLAKHAPSADPNTDTEAQEAALAAYRAVRRLGNKRSPKDGELWKKNLTCHKCHRRGHFADECPAKKSPPSSDSDALSNTVSSSSSSEGEKRKRREREKEKKKKRERKKKKGKSPEVVAVARSDGSFESYTTDPV